MTSALFTVIIYSKDLYSLVKDGMAKRALSVELPEDLMISLHELSLRTGRRKNLLVAASLSEFLKVGEEKQEEIIKKYLSTQRLG